MQSGCSKAKYASTHSLQMGPGFVPRMIGTLKAIARRTIDNLICFLIFPGMDDLLVRQRNSKTNTTDIQGWSDKTLVIRVMMEKIRDARCRYLILVYVKIDQLLLECNSSRKHDAKQY